MVFNNITNHTGWNFRSELNMENSAIDLRQDAMAGAPQEGSAPDNAADAGRGTDTVLAHMSLGEIVIPRAFQDDPQVMQLLQQIFQQGGADIAEFTVGDKANKINPETGYPEFGFFKKIFSNPLVRIAAPLALSLLAPGLGTALGSSILGAGAAGASTLGSGLIGAGLGAATGGGLKGALIGGLTGGVGANIGGVGAPGESGSGILGAAGRNIPGLQDAVSGVSDIGNSISDGFSSAKNAIGLGDATSSIPASQVGQAVTLGSGSSYSPTADFNSYKLPSLGTSNANIFANAGAAASPSTSSSLLGLGGSSSGGGSSFSGLGTVASALGGLQQNSALNKQKQQLLAGQTQQLSNLDNLNPTDVQNDPGYQFNLEQGQLGLNRALGAQGGLFSGNALKEASQYNQNFANNYYNQAYQRKAGLVGAQNDIYGNTANTNAAATGAISNNLNQTLANALGANVGNYNGGTSPALLALLKQRGLA
jgi:hypothetical protein